MENKIYSGDILSLINDMGVMAEMYEKHKDERLIEIQQKIAERLTEELCNIINYYKIRK